MKRLTLIAVLALVAGGARSEEPVSQKTVTLTQPELVALVQAQVAVARAQEAQAAAASVEAKVRAAFAPPKTDGADNAPPAKDAN